MGLFGGKDKGPGRQIERAKIVGVRTAEKSGALATYNYGVYSVLIRYDDGSVELVEERIDSIRMKNLLKYLEI